MSDWNEKGPPEPLVKANGDLILGAMVISAIGMVFIAIMLPGWAEIDGPFATWISIGLFVAAAGEIILGFYLRSVIRKAKAAAGANSVIRRD